MSGKERSTNIKIGSKEYEIIYQHPVEVDGEETWGLCDYAQCKILIDTEICEQMQFNSLIHELVHAVLYEMGNKLHTNEPFTEALSNMLAQVIIDNRDSYE